LTAGGEPQPIALVEENAGLARLAKLHGSLGDGVEHGHHFAGRARDHPQDFADRSLLLEGLFGFIKQSHVLDRDHRLVGEGLQQRDLLVAQRSCRIADNGDRPDRGSVLDHRDDRHGPVSRRSEIPLASREPFIHLLHVGHVDHPAIEDGHAVHVLACQREGKALGPPSSALRIALGDRHQAHLTVFGTGHRHARALEQTDPAANDRLEHGLHVGRGVRDDAQDLGGRRLLLERLLGLVPRAAQLDLGVLALRDVA
jgi:hypothetical protein